MAERSGTGLQNLVQRFDSASHLKFALADVCWGFLVPKFVPVSYKRPRFLYFKNRGYCIVVSLL